MKDSNDFFWISIKFGISALEGILEKFILSLRLPLALSERTLEIFCLTF